MNPIWPVVSTGTEGWQSLQKQNTLEKKSQSHLILTSSSLPPTPHHHLSSSLTCFSRSCLRWHPHIAADIQTAWQLWKYTELRQNHNSASLRDFNDQSVFPNLGLNPQQRDTLDSPDVWLTGRISYSVTLQPSSWAVLAVGNEKGRGRKYRLQSG